MKKIFFFAALLYLFMFIFFDSNTWESYKEKETKMGVEYVSVKHKLRWDRFFGYIRNIPDKILESGIFKFLSPDR